MKIIIFFAIIALPLSGICQKIPKGSNTINISGVIFKEAANKLLDAGFTFDKIDSNYQTLRTDFKDGTGDNKWMRLRLLLRVKDTIAILTGEWYNTMFVGSKLFGVEQTIENNTDKIKYTFGNPKGCFIEMNRFALSFGKPIEYLTK